MFESISELGIIRAALGLRTWPQEVPIVGIGNDLQQAINELDLDDITVEDVKDALSELAGAGNALGIQVGEAGTNILLANSAASEGAIVAGDIIQPSDLNYIYNRMSRENVPKFPMGKYFAIAHPDVIEDIKLQSAFTDHSPISEG